MTAELHQARVDAANAISELTARNPEHRTDTQIAALIEAADRLIDASLPVDMSDTERPSLPVSIRHGSITVELDVSLADVVIPGGDDHTHADLTLGHLVAAQIARNVIADMGDLRDHADLILRDLLTVKASQMIGRVLGVVVGDWRELNRADMTLAEMIEMEVLRQLRDPSDTTMARGRTGVPVIDAIVATAVTNDLRDLTAAEVAAIRGKILADIAATGGRG